jgi:hypothetical protein
VLHGCQAWNLRLREERRLRDPEANIWAKEGFEREWRRLHNQELHSLYRSLNIVKVIKFRRLRRADHITRIKGVLPKF